MRLQFTILTLFINIGLSVAQNINIPDTNFKSALINDLVIDTNGDDEVDDDVDTNNDGEIQLNEAKAVTNLHLSNKGIVSLQGIQNFSNLQFLNCSYNLIVDIDVSQNSQLHTFYVLHNKLSSLDVSSNLLLSRFLCGFNNLTEIDISNNLLLSTFNCRFNNLNSLDVSNNINLTTLGFSSNNITSIDVSLNGKLVFFTCASNNLEELNLSANHHLTWIQCHSNENLDYLDIRNGHNSDLIIMWADNTPNLRCILVDNQTYADNQECGHPTSGWCIDEDDIFSQNESGCNLGRDTNFLSELSIVPNPVDDVLHIMSNQNIISVSIFDINGRLLKNAQEKIIDVSLLPQGTYFLSIKTNLGSSIETILKM